MHPLNPMAAEIANRRSCSTTYKAQTMKHPITTLGMFIATAFASTLGFAAPYENGCWWDRVYPGPAQVTFNISDTLHVAQDAPVGTLLGGKEFSADGMPDAPAIFGCQNIGKNGIPLVQISYNAYNVAALATLEGGLPRVALPFPEDKIIRTNIPGVGASIRMQYWIDGRSPTGADFLLQGSEARVPFTSTRHHHNEAAIHIPGHKFHVSLVKTGTIPAGAYTLDPTWEMIRGELNVPQPDISTVLNFRLSGQVVSSGCSTAADPVTPNPVPLGEFDVKDFQQDDSSTGPVRFELNLVDCQPPAQGTVPRIHLQLDPDNGSSPIDAANGIFSTGSGTTGGGVAFQVLAQNGIDPMPLSTPVPIMTLPSGSAHLPLNARLVKHTGAVTPGTLTGALRFLLTYE